MLVQNVSQGIQVRVEKVGVSFQRQARSSWPSMRASVSTLPPADTAKLAAVCLRSFGVGQGRPSACADAWEHLCPRKGCGSAARRRPHL
jgi:hypothetical protein